MKTNKKITNDTFLRAARGEKTEHVPVWFMRQAGRSQPEYRAIKAKHSLFEITHQPELCAYVTALPVNNYNVDAAVLYKDIMTPLHGIGVDVTIEPGIGPVIKTPIKTLSDIEALAVLQPERDIPYVLETIRLLTEEMLTVPLIGFSGAPYTLASYLIEGGPSKTKLKTKAFMYNHPTEWALLMEKLAEMVIIYLTAQIEAGVSAVQLFDSWIGDLSLTDYNRYIAPGIIKILTAIEPLPAVTIMHGVHATHLMAEWNQMPLDVIGMDWRMSLTTARSNGVIKSLQGNMDPAYLTAPWPVLKAELDRILAQGTAAPGFIFNLGHGVFPEADPAVIKQVTAYVQAYKNE
ncbi:uroporphyrinogen decarboxylase [Brochothrix campestris]|uniref:Uroporphyrinogen decarboxylase n=1 Tax=Brochothrix campestris FSL F6-1037 TaxID=1265861 RepID=W7CFY7_9LIST|nr:uroporphyrinogen decarboxylase [Brochothrix campestris]EUJ35857.1 uroporphyrinogen decarboxylase [Brochothrix campestris FSL F6-1037]